MQRKDIDAEEFADLMAGMATTETTHGSITIASGDHPLYGPLILVEAAGSHAVLGNDVHLIVGDGETLESDMANAEA